MTASPMSADVDSASLARRIAAPLHFWRERHEVSPPRFSASGPTPGGLTQVYDGMDSSRHRLRPGCRIRRFAGARPDLAGDRGLGRLDALFHRADDGAGRRLG